MRGGGMGCLVNMTVFYPKQRRVPEIIIKDLGLKRQSNVMVVFQLQVAAIAVLVACTGRVHGISRELAMAKLIRCQGK